MTDRLTLPAGAVWATAPLLDKANVGRYVISGTGESGRYLTLLRIDKVGRELIHTPGGSFRAWHPHEAHGDFASWARTNTRHAEQAERHELTATIYRFHGWERMETDDLRTIAELVARTP